MIEAKPNSYALVVGCGEKGAAWAARKQNSEQAIIGLDIKQPQETSRPFVVGDVFNLPIKSSSINKIHADFIINGFDRRITVPEILNDPNVLDTDSFPKLIRSWYVSKLERSQNLTRDNVNELNVLLKTAAFREMWRVLEANGSLEILDFAYNIEWIKQSTYKIIQERPLLLRPRVTDITPEDFERSASLEKVTRGSTSVQKIILCKSASQTQSPREISISTVKPY